MPRNTKDKLLSNDRSRHFCVCEGPLWRDARFVSSWLSSVLNADRKVEKYILEHPKFRTQICRLEVVSLVEFAPIAMLLISKWPDTKDPFYERNIVFHVDIEQDVCAPLFAIMANIGFFKSQGDHYKMSIPSSLDMNVVRTNLLRLAETEDCEFYLHPECLVHTLNWRDTERCKNTLRRESLAAIQRQAKQAEKRSEKTDSRAMFG